MSSASICPDKDCAMHSTAQASHEFRVGFAERSEKFRGFVLERAHLGSMFC